MYHNAALVHDDIVDYSEKRRGKDTMHEMVGIPRAVNVGDATYLLALSFLLENLNSIGVSKAMHVMYEIEYMARQSVEGQGMELDWIANNKFDLCDEDYFQMVNQKTCCYTFIAPLRIGYIVGTSAWKEEDVLENLAKLSEFGMVLGIGFQITDDLLNLVGQLENYGKEIAGDIYEGKRTVMVLHALKHAGKHSETIKKILCKPRAEKKKKEVDFILEQMHLHGSIQYGSTMAQKFANKALAMLDELTFLQQESPILPAEKWDCALVDKRFITELVQYVVGRNV
jgi:geranylgeranyl diphosphate synthase type II